MRADYKQELAIVRNAAPKKAHKHGHRIWEAVIKCVNHKKSQSNRLGRAHENLIAGWIIGGLFYLTYYLAIVDVSRSPSESVTQEQIRQNAVVSAGKKKRSTPKQGSMCENNIIL